MHRTQATLLLSCIFAVVPAKAETHCIEYDPVQISLAGELQRLTFPGRPSYESVAAEDEPETGLYLSLPKPICTVGDTSSADGYPQQGVTLVQLVLDGAGYAQLRFFLGQEVVLSGTLFARHMGHHHAPLLLQGIKYRGQQR
jgi:hypothetical protein